MANYQARVKLTDTHINKLKYSANNKTGTGRLNKKNFQNDELLHNFFLTARQTTNSRNVFHSNIPLGKVKFKYLI